MPIDQKMRTLKQCRQNRVWIEKEDKNLETATR